jgi:hypothetical protein
VNGSCPSVGVSDILSRCRRHLCSQATACRVWLEAHALSVFSIKVIFFVSYSLPPSITGPSKAYQTSKVLATRPRNRCEYEKDTPVIPSENFDTIQLNNLGPAAQFSRLRVLVLMDFDNGLVGWESDDGSENPQ